jgi:hypothetical protein
MRYRTIIHTASNTAMVESAKNGLDPADRIGGDKKMQSLISPGALLLGNTSCNRFILEFVFLSRVTLWQIRAQQQTYLLADIQ